MGASEKKKEKIKWVNECVLNLKNSSKKSINIYCIYHVIFSFAFSQSVFMCSSNKKKNYTEFVSLNLTMAAKYS